MSQAAPRALRDAQTPRSPETSGARLGPLRAILFDFNGILVDDEPLHLALFQRVLEEEGVAMQAQDYEDLWLGLDDRGCLEAALNHAGRPAPVDYVARLVARKAAYYQAEVRRDGFRFFPGALELAREASEAGLMLGVVSGALHGEIEPALTVSRRTRLVEDGGRRRGRRDQQAGPRGVRARARQSQRTSTVARSAPPPARGSGDRRQPGRAPGGHRGRPADSRGRSHLPGGAAGRGPGGRSPGRFCAAATCWGSFSRPSCR